MSGLGVRNGFPIYRRTIAGDIVRIATDYKADVSCAKNRTFLFAPNISKKKI